MRARARFQNCVLCTLSEGKLERKAIKNQMAMYIMTMAQRQAMQHAPSCVAVWLC